MHWVPGANGLAASTRPAPATFAVTLRGTKHVKAATRLADENVTGGNAPSCAERSPVGLTGIVTDLTVPASGSVLRRPLPAERLADVMPRLPRRPDCRTRIRRRNSSQMLGEARLKTIAMCLGQATSIERPRPMRRR